MKRRKYVTSLPYPPSVNHIWRRVGRRMYLTPEAHNYKANVREIVRARGRPQPLRGSIAVTIRAYMPDKRKRDIDNLIKIILDSLTYAGIWGDDNQVDRIVVERGEVKPYGACLVRVEEMDDDKDKTAGENGEPGGVCVKSKQRGGLPGGVPRTLGKAGRRGQGRADGSGV